MLGMGMAVQLKYFLKSNALRYYLKGFGYQEGNRKFIRQNELFLVGNYEYLPILEFHVAQFPPN